MEGIRTFPCNSCRHCLGVLHLEIEHLKTSGLQDKALYDYTFSKDNGINPEIKLAHNYVSNWEKLVISTGTPFSRRALAMQPAKKDFPVPTSPQMRSPEAF